MAKWSICTHSNIPLVILNFFHLMSCAWCFQLLKFDKKIIYFDCSKSSIGKQCGYVKSLLIWYFLVIVVSCDAMDFLGNVFMIITACLQIWIVLKSYSYLLPMLSINVLIQWGFLPCFTLYGLRWWCYWHVSIKWSKFSVSYYLWIDTINTSI
jgi:hypothetical protein